MVNHWLPTVLSGDTKKAERPTVDRSWAKTWIHVLENMWLIVVARAFVFCAICYHHCGIALLVCLKQMHLCVCVYLVLCWNRMYDIVVWKMSLLYMHLLFYAMCRHDCGTNHSLACHSLTYASMPGPQVFVCVHPSNCWNLKSSNIWFMDNDFPSCTSPPDQDWKAALRRLEGGLEDC